MKIVYGSSKLPFKPSSKDQIIAINTEYVDYDKYKISNDLTIAVIKNKKDFTDMCEKILKTSQKNKEKLKWKLKR